MKGKLLWLFWIGIIGIAWNLVLIGHGLWKGRQLRRESEPCVEPRNPVWVRFRASLAWCRSCLRTVVDDSPKQGASGSPKLEYDYAARFAPFRQKGEAYLL
jgi:hypothetical protein